MSVVSIQKQIIPNLKFYEGRSCKDWGFVLVLKLFRLLLLDTFRCIYSGKYFLLHFFLFPFSRSQNAIAMLLLLLILFRVALLVSWLS